MKGEKLLQPKSNSLINTIRFSKYAWYMRVRQTNQNSYKGQLSIFLVAYCIV